ncbi:uncharacterized protein A1O5_11479 [Cladophialophora psammophila CBS 110553]|uniref:Uncharacterized protein n=1 Tax=Cladophialophora psammophila CBS 110553 TaxID=1182543 RepID=W9WEL7_9EURO|nr:uncharacterized protein A1O5_11479 [Cladophialophora psammophila CBS 110553]EXJ63430.1 hypothetical protein A1O5_11479 [Cladophialophora psammophila CBS 110553]
MASEVTADGHVLAPLNITAPAPILNLRGFKWDTVDEKIHGSQSSEDHERDAPQGVLPGHGQVLTETSMEQEPLVADVAPPFQRAAAVPPPAVLPAPTLSDQLAQQLSPPKPQDSFAPSFPLEQFQGTYAGNGFNMIFRPRFRNDNSLPIKPERDGGPGDNILELNLTREQLTFGQNLGKIPNRGLDVTNRETGKGDRLDDPPTGIHFEPGVWLHVPAANFQKKGTPSVVRMASIPHGTTVNAQGLIPTRSNTTLGGVSGPPSIDDIDTTPFTIGDPKDRLIGVFKSMDADNQKTFRVPQNLEKFNDKGQTITETISFEVSTGPPSAELNGGGTANISFLAGKQDPVTTAAPGKNDSPIANADFMKSKYWIERVAYQVNVQKSLKQTTMLLRPTMPSNSTAPTPVFAITTPPNGVPNNTTITVPGIQIQSSQTVNLNFMGLTWPHVSVSTLVPTTPQAFRMT